jgi:hypothetical protein
MNIISVATDFTRFPSGRYQINGTTSGEEFRERFLIPAISNGIRTKVLLDGTIGYGSSFLEEAFGGLVRKVNLSADVILGVLELETENQALKDEIIDYIKSAAARADRARK